MFEFATQKGKGFPTEFEEFLLRDVLHYATEDLDKLDMVKYSLALIYAQGVYLQRNPMAFMGGGGNASKNTKGKTPLDISLDHPEIKKYIEANKNIISFGGKQK